MEQPGLPLSNVATFYSGRGHDSRAIPARDIIGQQSPPQAHRVLRSILVAARDHLATLRSDSQMKTAEERCRDLLDRAHRFPDSAVPVRWPEHTLPLDLSPLSGFEVLNTVLEHCDGSPIGTQVMMGYWRLNRYCGRSYHHEWSQHPWSQSEASKMTSMLLTYGSPATAGSNGAGIVIGKERYPESAALAALSRFSPQIKQRQTTALELFTHAPHLDTFLQSLLTSMKGPKGRRNSFGTATFLLETWLKERQSSRLAMHVMWAVE